MARLGINALIIEGQPAERGARLGLVIDKNGVRFEELGALAGACTYEAAYKLREKYGSRAGLLIVGPAEAGIMRFGDYQRARELLEEVRRNTPMGRLLDSGSAICGRVFGVKRVPVVKGTGVTYATSPMGAEHTAANTIIAATDHLDPQGKAKLSIDLQVFTMVLDSLGMCIFTSRPILEKPALIENLVASFVGRSVSFSEMKKRAAEVLRRERDFNEGAGILAVHDRLPGFFATETLPPKNSRFDISAEELMGASSFLDEH